jgi:hypothetical protein
MWRDKDPVVRRCQWISPGRPLCVTRVALGGSTLCVVTKDGEAFTGVIPTNKASVCITGKICLLFETCTVNVYS